MREQQPKLPEDRVYFNNPVELEDWLTQHPEEPPFKAVLHLKNVQELQDWSAQHPEYLKENPKFGIDLDEPAIARVTMGPLAPDQIEFMKKLSLRMGGIELTDSEINAEQLSQPETNPFDQSDIGSRPHLRGGTDSPPKV